MPAKSKNVAAFVCTDGHRPVSIDMLSEQSDFRIYWPRTATNNKKP
jgi:hypothetical protein